MSPTKNATKKNKAAAEPADLAEQYGAPFPIYSEDEGARYVSLTSRGFNPPRCLDFGLIRSLGATKAINRYCRRLGWGKFVKMKHHGYQQLMLEFYTTLNFSSTDNNSDDDDDDEFGCRLMGKNVRVTRKTLCDIFGFYENGHATVCNKFDPVRFWEEISARGNYKRNRSNGLIKDPVLLIMHKYISHVVFGISEKSKVAEKDLFYLWCMNRKVGICTPSFLFGAFKSVIGNNRANMCLGNFITGIAVHFGVFDPDKTDMTVVPMRALDLVTLKNAQICVSDIEFKDFKERKCYKAAKGVDPPVGLSTSPPPIDMWMLNISRQLKKMKKRMNDGFDAMNGRFNTVDARFDALEKKVNTFEREWAGLRPEKLTVTMGDGVVAEELKRGNIDAADLVNDICELAASEEGANLEFPDSKGEKDSSGNGSGGLSKKGDGDSVQPRTREDDDDYAHNIVKTPQPETNECKEPQSGSVRKCRARGAHASNGTRLMCGEGCFSKITRPSSAARYIVEMIDSDDEANPNRAADDISNVCENEMNVVKSLLSTKRDQPDCVEDNLIVNSTTKRKKSTCTSDEDIVLIHEKENEAGLASDSQTPVEKSDGVNDEVSSDDSDDESLSDSRIDDLVASLTSKKRPPEMVA